MSPVLSGLQIGDAFFFEGESVKEFQGHPDQKYGHTTYSQNGEDLFIIELFNDLGISRPTYLDVGAFHPYNISNTALLYRFGSTGFTIDANPNCIKDFLDARPWSSHYQYGVVPEYDEIYTYLMFDPTSGRNTLCKNEAEKYSEKYGVSVGEEITVPTITLNDFVNKYNGGKFPHFLSLDVEGLDYDILKSVDFMQSAPVVICVETRVGQASAMSDLMGRLGFRPYAHMGENIIFVHISYFTRLLSGLGLIPPRKEGSIG